MSIATREFLGGPVVDEWRRDSCAVEQQRGVYSGGGTGGERCARWEVSGQQVGKSRKTQRRQVLGQTIGCHTCQVEQLADLFTEGNVAMGGEG